MRLNNNGMGYTIDASSLLLSSLCSKQKIPDTPQKFGDRCRLLFSYFKHIRLKWEASSCWVISIMLRWMVAGLHFLGAARRWSVAGRRNLVKWTTRSQKQLLSHNCAGTCHNMRWDVESSDFLDNMFVSRCSLASLLLLLAMLLRSGPTIVPDRNSVLNYSSSLWSWQ